MAAEQVSPRMELGELLSLEQSLLRALCLTVNSNTSEFKYRILEGLAEEDFYFPVTRSIFGAIKEFHASGDFVVASALAEVLRHVDVPDDFYVEDLFTGELPSSDKLGEWLARLKEDASSTWSAAELPPTPDGGLERPRHR